MSYHFWGTPDGRRFCYANAPTFDCPVAMLDTDQLDEGASTAAEALGVDPDAMLRLLVRGHRSMKRRRVNGRLTDVCDECGHRLRRHGFRVWIERPATDEELNSSASMRMQLTINGEVYVTERTSWCSTKREAVQWARDEVAQARAVLAEAA